MGHEFIRFIVAGVIAALFNWGSRFLFSVFLPYEIAVVCAFMAGVVTGFLIMRGWVFQSESSSTAKQSVRYLIINLIGLAQTVLISSILARWLLPRVGITDHAEAIAHGVGVLTPVITSYIGHRRFTFR